MLSSNMTENNESRIEFPNKEPDEWKMFYPFIDPFQIGEATRPTIDDENVMTLVPWFHEFQLNSLHQQCDQFLSDKALSLARAEKIAGNRVGCYSLKLDESFWDRFIRDTSFHGLNNLQMRRETFRDIIKLLEFSCIYDLRKTKIRTECIIKVLLGFNSPQKDMLHKTYDLFDDLPTIKILTSLFLPLSEEEATDDDGYDYKCIKSNGKSTLLWKILEDYWGFDDELKGLSLEDINTSPVFPVFVKSFFLQQQQARMYP